MCWAIAGGCAEAEAIMFDMRQAFFDLILANVRRMCWLSSRPQALPRWGLEILEKQISTLLKHVRSYDKPSSILSFDSDYTGTPEVCRFCLNPHFFCAEQLQWRQ